MADLVELHGQLACFLGLTQATVQLTRRAAVMAGQDNEPHLMQILERLDSTGEQIQRRCQLLVARHAELRVSRITSASRKTKLSIMGGCRQDAALADILKSLLAAVDQAENVMANLAARSLPDNDQAVAEFTTFALSAQKEHAAALRLSPYLRAAA